MSGSVWSCLVNQWDPSLVIGSLPVRSPRSTGPKSTPGVPGEVRNGTGTPNTIPEQGNPDRETFLYGGGGTSFWRHQTLESFPSFNLVVEAIAETVGHPDGSLESRGPGPPTETRNKRRKRLVLSKSYSEDLFTLDNSVYPSSRPTIQLVLRVGRDRT